jgi:hypothetical protein
MNIKLIVELVEKSDKDFALALVPADTLLKFVEVIVKECASLAYDGPGGILEHFGVEE